MTLTKFTELARRFRKLCVVAGVTGLVATGAALGAPVASADHYCSAGYHCVFLAGLGSARHSYFNTDYDFRNDTFEGLNVSVDNNTWSASNDSTGGYESHYYYGINASGGRVFCVNPGSHVNASQLTDDGINGNGIGQRDEASSLLLRGTTTIRCF